MNTTLSDLREQVQAEILSMNLGAVGYDLLMVVLKLSPVNSAVNTNVFQLSLPGSDQYELIKGFYPTRDGVQFSNVSSELVSADR